MQETKTKMPTTKEQVKAAIGVACAIADAIRELHEVPSGHLYAELMGHLSLDQYQAIIDGLERAKLIKVENHLITWIEEEVIEPSHYVPERTVLRKRIVCEGDTTLANPSTKEL